MLLLLQYVGIEAEAENHFSPIKALNSVMAMGAMTQFSDVNDSADAFSVKGGFKRFALAGLPKLTAEPWPKVAQLFVDLVKACPDAKGSGYGFEFISGKTKKVEHESAWAYRDVRFWA